VGIWSALADSSPGAGAALGVFGGSGMESGDDARGVAGVTDGDGGKFCMASSTFCSNSSWVMLDKEV
jgi:hypothetical protein